ncbi:hypothetical protein QBC40DRAFT_325613 [Triangularia verruculosa]|uniref:DUF7587 domain-containing protein n=1 Tax=Triangularia verruculosa TaxID=2587418 RepID=A0AAN6XT32_9PEZI|nr:hypothetical protein QBC40DRAFT_325613 [Triangularia verruculosa]
MASVPVQMVELVKLGARQVHSDEDPEHDLYIVRHRANSYVAENGVMIWEKEGTNTSKEIEEAYSITVHNYALGYSARFLSTNHNFYFPGGRPVLEVKALLSTCGGEDRPSTLYRVIHQGRPDDRLSLEPTFRKDPPNPFGGLKARGHKVIKLDPTNRQILIQKHLLWNCRQLSPFLSVTSSLDKAVAIQASYLELRFKAPEIMEIDSTHPSWDHAKQKLFDMKSVTKELGLIWRNFYSSEYLVEHSIPEEAVTRRFSVEQTKAEHLEKFEEATEKRRLMDTYNEKMREWREKNGEGKQGDLEEKELPEKLLEGKKRKAAGPVGKVGTWGARMGRLQG